MNITRQQTDSLNALITIDIEKEDYFEKTEKTLNDYRKNATIPGFRKGNIPMRLIRNKYERAVIFEEINKILQQSIRKYLTDEKLNILCEPLPIYKDNSDYSGETFSYDFEIALEPEFSVDLDIKDIIRYKIIADDNDINKQIEHITKKHGELFPKEEYQQGDELTGVFTIESEKTERKAIISENINNTQTTKKNQELGNIGYFLISLSINKSIFGNKNVADKFIGKKVGDQIAFSTEELFPKFSELVEYFDLPHDSEEQSFNISFIISEINGYKPAEINQEFFDKAFEGDNITSEEEMRQKIKNDFQIELNRLQGNSSIGRDDMKFLNEVADHLVENTKFDLPTNFLKRWIQETSETPIQMDEAEQKYNSLEKSLRYDLIEKKIISQNNIQVDYDEVKSLAYNIIERLKARHIQYTEEEIEKNVNLILSDKDQLERLYQEALSLKILNLFTEKSGVKIKEVSLEKFLDTYKKN